MDFLPVNLSSIFAFATTINVGECPFLRVNFTSLCIVFQSQTRSPSTPRRMMLALDKGVHYLL